jgi:hypothetical protein
MKQSVLENLIAAQLSNKFPLFSATWSSQQPTSGSCPKPVESNPQTQNLLLQALF